MKQLNSYINEKLIIRNDSKIKSVKDSLCTNLIEFANKYKLKFGKLKDFGGFSMNQLVSSNNIREFWKENKMSHYNIEDVKKYKEEINKLFASKNYHIDLTTFDFHIDLTTSDRVGMTIQIITGEHWDAQATIDSSIHIKVILKKETTDKEKEAEKILIQTLDYITQDKI